MRKWLILTVTRTNAQCMIGVEVLTQVQKRATELGTQCTIHAAIPYRDGWYLKGETVWSN
jgi:hypothetical protein